MTRRRRQPGGQWTEHGVDRVYAKERNCTGTETLALTDLQQRLEVCENNWLQKIATVERAGRRIMVKGRDGSAALGA